MITRYQIFCVLFCVISYSVSAQSIEISGFFSSSNAKFYQNVPGLKISYTQHFNMRYLFAGISSSFKMNSYSEIGGDPSGVVHNIMRDVEGKLFVNSISLGIARNLFNKQENRLSIGGYASLNYFKFNDERHYFLYESGAIGYDYVSTYSELIKNKLGLGCFLEIELKSILFDNTSLFTRMNTEIIFYDARFITGSPFHVGNIFNFRFHLGIKIYLNNNHYY